MPVRIWTERRELVDPTGEAINGEGTVVPEKPEVIDWVEEILQGGQNLRDEIH